MVLIDPPSSHSPLLFLLDALREVLGHFEISPFLFPSLSSARTLEDTEEEEEEEEEDTLEEENGHDGLCPSIQLHTSILSIPLNPATDKARVGAFSAVVLECSRSFLEFLEFRFDLGILSHLPLSKCREKELFPDI